MVGEAAHLGATGLAAAGGAAAATSATDQSPGRNLNLTDYLADTLFRSARPGGDENNASVRAEVGRILANALRQEDVPAADQTYLAQLVAAKTGLSPADAQQRVATVVTQVKNAAVEARQAADTARKATAHTLLWIFLALLIGAFCASYAATIGGRQRDYV
jgi:plasmid stability protein